MLKFQPSYFISAVLLFIIEVLIAVYIHDQIIRPFIGDLLVVILLYCFVKSFLNTKVYPTAISVLLFAYAIETLQYLNLVGFLGLADHKLANIIIGNYFTWIDMLMYTLGILIVLLIEGFNHQRKQKQSSAKV